jgi:hypothetical protein
MAYVKNVDLTLKGYSLSTARQFSDVEGCEREGSPSLSATIVVP